MRRGWTTVPLIFPYGSLQGTPAHLLCLPHKAEMYADDIHLIDGEGEPKLLVLDDECIDKIDASSLRSLEDWCPTVLWYKSKWYTEVPFPNSKAKRILVVNGDAAYHHPVPCTDLIVTSASDCRRFKTSKITADNCFLDVTNAEDRIPQIHKLGRPWRLTKACFDTIPVSELERMFHHG